MQYQHGGDIYSQETEMDYSANISPLGLPEGVKRTLLGCLGTNMCSVYPDSGCRKLTEDLGRHHGVPREWVVCGNGAADLIFGLAYAKKPRRGLVMAPTFLEYEQALRAVGCRVDYLCLAQEHGFMPVLGQLEAQLARADAQGEPYDMMFLCNPNNPTGIPVTAEFVRRAAGACGDTGTLLVVDECFCEFLDEPEAYSAVGDLGRYRNLFVLRAFTKLYAMAGLRLGYGLCSDGDLLECLGQVRQPWSVSGLAQKAGEAALGEKEYVGRVRELVSVERGWLRRELEALGFTVYGSMANYLFFQAPDILPGEIGGRGWLYHTLLGRKVLIRSCSNYPGLDASFYRICVKTREENERLMEHMKAAMDVFKTARRGARGLEPAGRKAGWQKQS